MVMVQDSAFIHQVTAIIDPVSPLRRKPKWTIAEPNRRLRSTQSSGQTGHGGRYLRVEELGTKTVPGSGRGKSLPLIS
jgi:hypothetical protein